MPGAEFGKCGAGALARSGPPGRDFLPRRSALLALIAPSMPSLLRAQDGSLLSIADYEALAEKRVARGAWERIQGGAADELTLRWNKEAYQRIRLRPRVLIDVSKLDTRVRLFGQELAYPIILAPTGGQKLIHPEA